MIYNIILIINALQLIEQMRLYMFQSTVVYDYKIYCYFE